MRFYYGVFLLTITISITLNSCREETLENSDFGYNYFPLKVGAWWIYDVDSTYYDEFSKDTFQSKFQIKEIIDTLLEGADNKPIFRIGRYKRMSETSPWIGPRYWWADTMPNKAIKAEENNIYVKLIFPQRVGNQWNGNVQNIFEPQNYTITFKDKKINTTSLTIDSALTVLQFADTSNKIQYKLYDEKYGRRIGLVAKTIIDIKGYTDAAAPPDTINKPILQRIKSGVVYKMTLNSYGQ